MIFVGSHGVTQFSSEHFAILASKLLMLPIPARSFCVSLAYTTLTTHKTKAAKMFEVLYDILPPRSRVIWMLPYDSIGGNLSSYSEAQWNLNEMLSICADGSGKYRVPDAFHINLGCTPITRTQYFAKQTVRWYEQALYEKGIYNRKIYLNSSFLLGFYASNGNSLSYNFMTAHPVYSGKQGGKVFPKDYHSYYHWDDSTFEVSPGGSQIVRGLDSTSDGIITESGIEISGDRYYITNFESDEIKRIYRNSVVSSSFFSKELNYYVLWFQSYSGWNESYPNLDFRCGPGIINIDPEETAEGYEHPARDFKVHSLFDEPTDQHPITLSDVDDDGYYFLISKTLGGSFHAGDEIIVSGTDGNDGTYTVDSYGWEDDTDRSHPEYHDKTYVYVTEAIATRGAGGYISVPKPRNLLWSEEEVAW